MTQNYFVRCPICGTTTRMRTPIGYIYKTPVRFHCGGCGSLLTGEFIVDNEKAIVKYIPINCEEVSPQDCDFLVRHLARCFAAKLKRFMQ